MNLKSVWQKGKKRKTHFCTSIIAFFSSPKHYKPTNLGQQQFIEHLILFITKRYLPMSFIENPWL
jgi:hypothetical protein